MPIRRTLRILLAAPAGVWLLGVLACSPRSAPIQALAIKAPRSVLLPGSAEQLQVIGTYSDQSKKDLTAVVDWISSSPTSLGFTKALKGSVTAGVPGRVQISAYYAGSSASTSITVSDATIRSLAVDPATPFVAVGSVEQLTATATLSDSTTADVTASAEWNSSDLTVARLSEVPAAPGSVAGISPGTVKVAATVDGLTASVPLLVTSASLQAIEVRSPMPNLAKGSTVALQAIGTFSDQTRNDVTSQVGWTTSDPAVAIVSRSGVVTGVAPGPATLRASLAGSSGTSEIAVKGPALAQLHITPSEVTIASGATQPFTATAVYSDQSTAVVTTKAIWSSSAPVVAKISSASGAQGVVTTLTDGTATLTASFSGMVGTAALKVGRPEKSLAEIAIAPTMAALALGATQSFTATATYSDGSSANVTSQVAWESSNTSVANIGVGGLVTGVAGGDAQITATIGAVVSPPATASVSAPRPRLVSITLTPVEATVPRGGLQPLVATGAFSNSVTQLLTSGVTWSSSSNSVVVVDSSGVATATGESGTASVIASVGGVVSAPSILTIGEAPRTLVQLTITPTASTLHVGGQQQLTAVGTYNDGSTEPLSIGTAWTAAAPGVAGVSMTGLLTALAPGTTEVKVQVGSIASRPVAVSVLSTAAQLVSVSVSPSVSTATPHSAQQFTVTAIYNDGTTSTLTTGVKWQSARENVAAIDSQGLAVGALPGAAAITAGVGALTSESATLNVAASAPELVSLAVSPALTTASIGGSAHFTAWGTYSDGATLPLASGVSWSSSVPSGVAVSNSGLATALAEGSANIAARVGAIVSSNAVLQVPAPPKLVSIAVTPSTATGGIGGTVLFTATGTYSDGSALPLTSGVTWSSSTRSVATIDSQGQAESNAGGLTNLTASVGAVTSPPAILTVTTGPPKLVAITLTPASSGIGVEATQAYRAIGSYADHSTHTLTAGLSWKSSSSAVATVGEDGIAKAVGPGVTVLTATAGDIASTPAVLSVAVADRTLVSITVVPAAATLSVWREQQFAAVGLYSDNTAALLSDGVVWTSFAPGAATIANNGIATGVAIGTTKLTAALGCVASAPARLQVASASAYLLSIVVTPEASVLSIGGTLPLTATGTFADQTSRDVTATVHWESDAPEVARVDNGGTVIAVAQPDASARSARIIAAIGSTQSASLQLTVVPYACTPTINEVQPGDSFHPADEWVEIYNPCAAAVDLTGYTLQSLSAQGTTSRILFTFSGSLPSQGFKVCGGPDYRGANDCPLNAPDAVGSYGYLSGTAGGLALVDPNGVDAVSSMGWGSAAVNVDVNTSPAAWIDSGSYRSLIRIPDGQISGDDSVDFVSTSALTPGGPNIFVQ